ncbi:hypothetical protein Pcinc_018363 [Petrolisthes cinctipes]|uniref:Uncharacterized protein n=1 Tax=Petrolisthes cinctipes TaxID=88211 RepID=A0AAE1BW37_PETCI|nr:hypothetical protein Pcinc_035663 [Petrolisthes cinctipes]KAK3876881.1 hypothetical protein Pcinc_018363 [Petrolisthes cinctipes]
MVDGGAWKMYVGVATVCILVCASAALPTHILLPISQESLGRYETGQDLSMLLGIEDNIPTHLHSQRLHQVIPQKRYLGIELPDFIAAGKSLGDLKEKMKTSGK